MKNKGDVVESELLFPMDEFSDPRTRKPPESEAEKALGRIREMRHRELRNLERKVERGLTLTGAEQKRLKELEANFESADGRDHLPDHVVRTADEAAAFFSRNVRTLRRWIKDGAPCGANTYDLIAIGQWALARGLIAEMPGPPSAESAAGGNKPIDDGTLNRSHYETRIKQLDSELKSMKLAKEKGQLFERAWIVREWTARAAEYARGLEFLEMRLPPILEGKNQLEMRSIIRDEVWQMRERLCRTGRFCPPMDSAGGLESTSTMLEGAA